MLRRRAGPGVRTSYRASPVTAPPLSLYVHVPWCVRKCPYCDFNSHEAREGIPESRFIDALLADLELDLRQLGERPLISIFIGGGTPSLLSADAVSRLLRGIKLRLDCAPGLEVTLEANPGTADAGRFAGFREAGVDRLSLGIQSFGGAQLAALGRIHGPDEAVDAVRMAQAAGFDNLNLDLMFGLPGQTLAGARRDVETALDLAPRHLSYYQLTLEPNTPFHWHPPALPDADQAWEFQDQGQCILDALGYRQYEVSAYAQPGSRCRHNLNYWQFGDYVGIGPGAHGKLTGVDGHIVRTVKPRSPDAYLKAWEEGALRSGRRMLVRQDLVLEFLMNALRLTEGFSASLFEDRTGLPFAVLEPNLRLAEQRQLIERVENAVICTPRGYAFLNDLLSLFDPC